MLSRVRAQDSSQLRSPTGPWDGFQGLSKACELRALQFTGWAGDRCRGALLWSPGTSKLLLNHHAGTRRGKRRCPLSSELGSRSFHRLDTLPKCYDQPRRMLKSRDIALPTKVHLVKAMAFPVVMYSCESWTIKKAEHQRIDAFELWCWRRLLRVPWTARRSNQSILKEISPGCSLEGLMLKLKLQYFGHLIRRTDSLEKTTEDLQKSSNAWGLSGGLVIRTPGCQCRGFIPRQETRIPRAMWCNQKEKKKSSNAEVLLQLHRPTQNPLPQLPNNA